MSELVVEKPQRSSGRAPAQTHSLGAEVGEMATISRGLVAYNLGYLAFAWAIAIAAIALFWANQAWWTFILAFLLVSSRQQALLNCEHECVHRKFLPGRRLNALVGTFLCAAPVGSPFGVAQARHLAHHRLLGTPEDPDRELHSGEPPKDSRWGLFRYFAHGLLGGYAIMVFFGPKDGEARPAPVTARRDLFALIVVQAAIAAGLTLAFDWWVYPALWLAPLATVTALCHLIRSFAEHAIAGKEAEDHANRLITIQSNPLERGLVSPYFMNYHAEHHLLPSVPAPRLRELRRRLEHRSDLPPVLERSSYTGALRSYVRALRG